jgi:hypothetical protein
MPVFTGESFFHGENELSVFKNGKNYRPQSPSQKKQKPQEPFGHCGFHHV